MNHGRADRDLIGLALSAVLCLLVTGVAIFSATGGEQVGVRLVALILLPSVITVGCLLIWYQRLRKRRALPAFLGTIASLGVIASVQATHWPLRATYALSRSSFDVIAQRLRNGESIETPIRAGLFTIERAELSNGGIVCLWTELNPGGDTGFVQCRRDYVPFNLWSIIKLDDHWQFISED